MKYYLGLGFTLSLAIPLFLSVRSNEAATYVAFIHNFFEDGETIQASILGKIREKPFEILHGEYEKVAIYTEGSNSNLHPHRRLYCVVKWHSKILDEPRHGYFVLFDAIKKIPPPEDTIRDRTGALIYFVYVNGSGAYITNLDGTKKLKSPWVWIL